MLTCKNVVIVNGEKDAFTAVPYDRIYLDFASTDSVESFGKNNKSKAILNANIAGHTDTATASKEWQGTRPAKNVTDVKDVAPLIQDAINQLEKEYGALPDYKDVAKDQIGWLLLLHAADYGRDLWVRAKIQADTRPAKAVDPAVAKEQLAKSMIKEAASNGKVLTMEKALARIAKLAAMEAEDDAA